MDLLEVVLGLLALGIDICNKQLELASPRFMSKLKLVLELHSLPLNVVQVSG